MYAALLKHKMANDNCHDAKNGEIREKVRVPVDEDNTASSKLHQVTSF